MIRTKEKIKKQSCQCTIKKGPQRFPVIHLPKSMSKHTELKVPLKVSEALMDRSEYKLRTPRRVWKGKRKL